MFNKLKKIAVIDIETTGLDEENDLIIEIGIVELDLDSGNIRELFNSLIYEKKFNFKLLENSPFSKNLFKPEEFEDANRLEDVTDELQEIFNNYKVTAFNKRFDFSFLRNRGFSILNEFPCIMMVSARILKIPGRADEYKWPSMQKTYDFLFPKEKFIEKHRALDDAYNEAKILYKLYIDERFVEMEFSRPLEEVYSRYVSRSFNKSNIKKKFEHCPRNPDEAIYYLKTKFPLHYAKSRRAFQETNCIPLGCGKINIVDFGCGPFTFSLGLIDEILINSEIYGGGSFELKIFGLDKSFFSLMDGLNLIEELKKEIYNRAIKIEVITKHDDGNFDDIDMKIEDWLESNPADYYILGYNASMSSGIKNFNTIVEKLIKRAESSVFYTFVIEPFRYQSGLNLDELNKNFQDNMFYLRKLESSCKKPKGMQSNYSAIYSDFKALIGDNRNKYITEVLEKSNILKYEIDLILILNKVKRWLLQERLTDFIGIYLTEWNIDLTSKLFKNYIPNYKNMRFLNYKIQKGLIPNKYRNFTLINFPVTTLSIIILSYIGKKLDDSLNKSVLGSRFCKIKRIDRIYQFFTIGYNKFSNFEIERDNRQYLLCLADIKNYFDSIDRNLLKENLINKFDKLGIPLNYIPILLNLIGDQKGIPIGSSLSSLIANLMISDLDSNLLSHPYVVNYARYMDDLKIILKAPNDKESREEFKDFLKTQLNKLNLELKEEKFEIKDIDRNSFKYEYNRIFKEYTKRYFDLIRPIKYGLSIILYLQRKKEKIINKSNLKNMAEKISKALELQGIIFNEDALLKYLILVNFKLNNPEFIEEIEDLIKSKDTKFKINKNILDFASNEFPKYFLEFNWSWLSKCYDFAKEMYNKLNSELEKWDHVHNSLDQLDDSKNEDLRGDIIKQKKEILENEEFLYSVRMIKYLIYRLTKMNFFKLKGKSNIVINKIIKFIRLFFPIKLIGLILYKYDHIGILKKLLEQSMEILDEDQEIYSRKIYPNDISYLIHLLGLYYEKKPDKLPNDIEYWLEKIDLILLTRPYEEKIAISEFILRLNLVNKISYHKFKIWFGQADNLLVLKNILICIAFHSKSSEYVPIEFLDLILKKYSLDEVIMNLTLRLYTEIKKKKKINIFHNEDVFNRIKVFPNSIDLDYELRSIFDWEEGFGGSFFTDS